MERLRESDWGNVPDRKSVMGCLDFEKKTMKLLAGWLWWLAVLPG